VNKSIKKIAIVGPESTGKSTLAKELAKHYGVAWVPEFSRYYCANLIQACTLQDEINMFYGQVALEQAVLATADTEFIICDTTFLTIKVWSDEFFGHTPEFVIDALMDHPYDFYILLDIDLPWEDDPLRDFPNKRGYFMEVWHKELTTLKANYIVVDGLGKERLQNAIKTIDDFLNT
jgi:NadR type nicotinamide-nucleotide adenylyltransferase